MGRQYLDLPIAPPDVAFGLMAKYDADAHPNKVSLIAGAYRDENGSPWVLPSVERAKSLLSHTPANHEYLPIAGSPTFLDLAQTLILGPHLTATMHDQIASIQTVSGTGANHLAASFLAAHQRPQHVFIPAPTWVNHKSIWATISVPQIDYPYYSPTTRGVDLEGMCAVLDEHAAPHDVIILQACAHNPTGLDLTRAQWEILLEVVRRKRLFVVFDSAYQGFATGDVDGDAWAVRYFAEQLLGTQPEGEQGSPGLCVAQSFSKNFGLYGERVGALHLVVPRGMGVGGARSQLVGMARAEYSNPPRFGATIVETVLGDSKLRTQWEQDLRTMSARIARMRSALRTRLELNGTPGDWSHVEKQIGMFSYTGLETEQVARLRDEYHIYLLPSGRVSICGLTEGNVDYVADAIRDVVLGRRDASA
ncbi:aspartate aminotransferase, cytoplasmic [Aspergillus brunneoviolaceus CBS 621.78]|uniref:Aspartate aminotransferase, cytoplasmic n=1 Tax=Aspergillus brunneoviolaceus CBS 621.78 TaxID=1450534 RepID=A0ACD1FV72_9EURO|nr:aspartate aminotransferase, cytoplasmic [Aspergillus brunneoviolaceus CBS 621.78]RAH40903.1 aspartate aminotransferase, cytoplasmic [Aspergillus brunneoviolaceus CBS 621.78]